MEKKFSHFDNPKNVSLILQEMKKRHPGGYQSVLNSIVTQISGYYNRNSPGFQTQHKGSLKFLLGLSGGIDSVLVTYLAVKAVGVEHVIPVTMPARDDDTECITKAKIVRDRLGINNPDMPYVIPIGEIVKKDIELINSLNCDHVKINTHPGSQSFSDKIRIGNFGSRTRIKILYDLANKLSGRVLGTGNRIEYLQGYAAKYGTPISFDYGVLDELYKVDIMELAALMGIPTEIIHSVPSTGYFTNQTHEDELGATMEEQDAVSYLLFEKAIKEETVVSQYGAKKEFVQLMMDRYRNSHHKRMLKQEHVLINRE